MVKGLYSAATGMQAQQIALDVIAHNLANVNTAGYKRAQALFQELVSVSAPSGTGGSSSETSPVALAVGSGARTVGTTRTFSLGDLDETRRPLDLAIQGDGFFRVEMSDGSMQYTRDGGLHLDATGRLVTADGLALADNISVPETAREVTVAGDGSVVAQLADGTTSTLGQIQLARFVNPAGLAPEGGNRYSVTPRSGAATDVAPGASGAGTILQGFVERSNVDVVTELVHLIQAQRAYEVNSRAVRASDRMLENANAVVS